MTVRHPERFVGRSSRQRGAQADVRGQQMAEVEQQLGERGCRGGFRGGWEGSDGQGRRWGAGDGTEGMEHVDEVGGKLGGEVGGGGAESGRRG